MPTHEHAAATLWLRPRELPLRSDCACLGSPCLPLAARI